MEGWWTYPSGVQNKTCTWPFGQKVQPPLQVHICLSCQDNAVCRRDTVLLRFIILCRKIHPAVSTLQQNDNFPIRDKSSCCVHLSLHLIQRSSFLSSEILRSFHLKAVQVNTKEVIEVVGPSTLDSFIRAFIYFSCDVSIDCRFCAQSCEAAVPAVKES